MRIVFGNFSGKKDIRASGQVRTIMNISKPLLRHLFLTETQGSLYISVVSSIGRRIYYSYIDRSIDSSWQQHLILCLHTCRAKPDSSWQGPKIWSQ